MSGPRVGVAVPAAGSGRRMGGVRKPFLSLAGEPLLLHALRPFLARDDVRAVVVALAAGDAVNPPAWLVGADPRVRVVEGGRTRGESVGRALRALPDDVDVVAVHDAARPLLQADVLARCIEIAAAGEGAVAGCPAVDTVKEVDEEGRIVATPPRSRLWQAQTPQVFPRSVLVEAYGLGEASATDDAALVERVGCPVRMVDAGPWNLKVTHPADVDVAEVILARRRSATP